MLKLFSDDDVNLCGAVVLCNLRDHKDKYFPYESFPIVNTSQFYIHYKCFEMNCDPDRDW